MNKETQIDHAEGRRSWAVAFGVLAVVVFIVGFLPLTPRLVVCGAVVVASVLWAAVEAYLLKHLRQHGNPDSKA